MNLRFRRGFLRNSFQTVIQAKADYSGKTVIAFLPDEVIADASFYGISPIEEYGKKIVSFLTGDLDQTLLNKFIIAYDRFVKNTPAVSLVYFDPPQKRMIRDKDSALQEIERNITFT